VRKGRRGSFSYGEKVHDFASGGKKSKNKENFLAEIEKTNITVVSEHGAKKKRAGALVRGTSRLGFKGKGATKAT